MANLIKIGNSQGIRIPKVLIEQAHLEGKNLKFQVIKDGLLVSAPNKQARAGWREAIEISLKNGGREPIDKEWLDAPLVSESEWEW